MSNKADVHVPHGSTDGTINDEKVTATKIGSGAVTATKIGSGAVTAAKIGSGAVTAAKIGSGAVTPAKQATNAKRRYIMSQEFNIDAGAGVNVDDLMLHTTVPITPIAAQVTYTEQTDSGDASGATIQLGTTKGGSNIVAATNLENAKAVGSKTALTLGSGVDDVPANGNVWARLTGIAATQVGKFKVVLEYVVND